MSTNKVNAAIVGSTGYGGVELIRLLASHPYVEVTSVISSSSEGTPIAEGYPHLTEIRTDLLDGVDPQAIRAKADVVFLATPAGIAAKLVPDLLEAGLKVIDISGDFRLKSPALYEQWYKKTPADENLLAQAVYGLAEVYGDRVADVDLISNPGCFPTASLLGLIPAVAAGWIDPATIIIDAKSGVSGAGRGASLGTHYSELNENFRAYKINKHQHIPEIEQVLTDIVGKPVTTTFTTHLVPMTRGIMSTMYATVIGGRTDKDFVELYSQYYEGRKFVRVRPEGKWPMTKEVWGSNYCDIGFSVDERTGRVTIVSVIDNLVKGAAGQAIQNLNLMMGWDETLGLQFVPVYP
ncbi:N-acetyl-gamma-glutamyl-phosphate reductase [Paenibacillus curdlanolyticus YK9]|uniref:N-acetyl-gamma-glutamyl-phosphate reductase n=1 Tax=Paenibacillus curdlanolyticus YK9 TaxID=717606 RepID=E0IEB1_9BACL|nr:N-acetyl-gamma-glutamyl-phosphate reductase [Paenibacillus curdlanolyticus]EFM08999.1 N-acetyl-gamma-glutamyl-phosphate reductase [Paenibacillus curdlanolyticus YK9]